MPVTPFITAGIELTLNRILYRDQALRTARQRLRGKVLCININALKAPVILVFSEQHVDVLGKWEGNADCTVTTQLNVLPRLRDRQQLTTLIKQGALDVEGDIQVLQYLGALFEQAEFDFAELIAPYTGDIVAETVSKALRGGRKLIKTALQRNQRYLAEAITEEWHLAPPPLEQAWFAEEVSALVRELNALEWRMNKLEAQ